MPVCASTKPLALNCPQQTFWPIGTCTEMVRIARASRAIRQRRTVWYERSKVGTLTRGTDGAISDTYDPSWLSSDTAFPVASALPLSKAKWQRASVVAAFENLLPDAGGRTARNDRCAGGARGAHLRIRTQGVDRQMPQPARGARLFLRKRAGRERVWVINDIRQPERSAGNEGGASMVDAAAFFATSTTKIERTYPIRLVPP